MFKTDHIKKLTGVGYYKAPCIPGHNLGAKISPSTEMLEVLTGGEVDYEVSGGKQRFGVGTIFWHLSGEMTIRKNVIENPYECLVLKFETSEEIPRQVPEVTIMRQASTVGSLSSELLAAYHDNIYDKNKLCQYIYNRFLWEAYSSTKLSIDRKHPRSLKIIIDYIHKHYGKDLLVEDLALKGGVSTPYLFSLFQKHLSISPHKYLLTIRLKEACTLLASTTFRIKRISDECGFMNTESFCRNFKKAYKMTPGKYRERSFPY